MPKQRKRTTPAFIPALSELLVQPAPQKQTPWVTPKQVTRQTPGIPELFRTPKIVAPTTFKAPIWPLGGGDSAGKGGGKDLFGRWFRKQQQIKTPQQMLETFFGSKRRRKRK